LYAQNHPILAVEESKEEQPEKVTTVNTKTVTKFKHLFK
jgi:hypothetical protein